VDKPSSWVKMVHFTEFEEQFTKFVNLTTIDCSHYKEVKVFGDIHGCADALNKALQYNEDTLYVFLGDYFDRGIQNTDVFKILQELQFKKNVCMLEGNREANLRTYLLTGKTTRGTTQTIEELKANGITDTDIRKFYDGLSQLMYFTYHGQKYLCTHGGVPVLPNKTHSTRDIVYGVGAYEADVTVMNQFHSTNPDIIQIYGHRNTWSIERVNQCVNLCGRVEFGETLPVATINTDGLTVDYYKQDVFNPELTKKPVIQSTVIPADGLLMDFKQHKNIQVKELNNGVFAVNFTSKLFKSRQWTTLALKARGLFIDSDSKVVARSWNKYFNYKEMPETKADALQQNLVYPVSVYEKYNGFLGILSLHNDEWFICSKSTNEGNYAEMFKELVTPYLTEQLKAYIKDSNVTMLFEVNHLNDRHIVQYKESHIVLLDVVKNELEESKLNYLDLQEVSHTFNFRCKKLVIKLNNYAEWREFRLKEKAKDCFTPDTEGYVLEDSSGFKFKLKSNYYSFWKRMRGLVESVAKRPSQLPTIKSRLHTGEEFQFYNFIVQNTDMGSLKDSHIIDLRLAFMSQLRGRI
jgi:hypothetical protein